METLALNADQVRSASFHTCQLTDLSGSIQVYPVTESWCSLTLNWNTAAPYGNRISETAVQGKGAVALDITAPVKSWLSSNGIGQDEGVLMKGEGEADQLWTSCDSSFVRFLYRDCVCG